MTFPIPPEEEIQHALKLAERPQYVAKGGFKAVFRASMPDGPDEAIKAVFVPPESPDGDVLAKEQLLARAAHYP